MPELEIETPHGPARAHLHPAHAPAAALMLGHGAGGGVGARDLLAATRAANAESVSVALVEQPYRVAGRRSPPRAPQLDADWVAIAEHLLAGPFAGLPLIAGGRSSGARVACRTHGATGAIGVLCLAFPLLAPARRGTGERPTREPELDLVTVPTLIVQGERDPFGMPPPAPGRTVVGLAGDHRLVSDLHGLTVAVREWLGILRA